VASDNAEAEHTIVMGLRESAWSCDFGASSVTVGLICQLESLRYLAEGSACEQGEETILELADEKAVVFTEFFAAWLQMPPHPALTEILLNYRVQLHRLIPNAIARLSK
jgi:hypothetical protein